MALFRVVFLLVVYYDVTAATPTGESKIVSTKYGLLRGVTIAHDGKHFQSVEAFLGVPYASPPTGNLRFMPPVTASPWKGIRTAQRHGPACPQRLPDVMNETEALMHMPRGRLEAIKRLLPLLQQQSEDCLYLNIYVPKAGVVTSSSRASHASSSTVVHQQHRSSHHTHQHPVLVFIHGESFEWNSGNAYDGSILASYASVVVVTLNYRLGVLGFLNANPDPHLRSPANYGLMDQIAALHWIQENVAEFGGDPTTVTVIGHGTGAACVQFLMTSGAVPQGMLFHRAALMSGSSLSPWALVRDPLPAALQVARAANCSPAAPPAELLRCLRDRPLSALLAAHPVTSPMPRPAFAPSVDGVVIDEGAGGVAGAMAAGATAKKMADRLSRYDLLFGVVRAEAYLALTADDEQYGFEADRRAKLLRSFVRSAYRWHRSEILATVVNEYTDWERPVQHPVSIRDETLEALADAQIVAPLVRTGDLHAAPGHPQRTAYFYVFDYQTKYGDYPQRAGCVHGEELPYVFGAPLASPNGLITSDGGHLGFFARNFTKAEVVLSEATMLYWTNFARTGNPNEPTAESLHQPADSAQGIMTSGLTNPNSAANLNNNNNVAVVPSGVQASPAAAAAAAAAAASRQERNRFRGIEWPPYDRLHKKHLLLDPKPRIKSHYRAHRLSFWLALIPELHRPGGDDVPVQHHLLDDATDEEDVLDALGPNMNLPRRPSSGHGGNTSDHLSPTSSPTSSTLLPSAQPPPPPPLVRAHHPPPLNLSVTPTTSVPNGNNAGDYYHHPNRSFINEASPPSSSSAEDGFAAYSTALSVTIAIGCSLLILNVLIFAGVYYQRDKGGVGVRGPKRRVNENGQVGQQQQQHHHVSDKSVGTNTVVTTQTCTVSASTPSSAQAQTIFQTQLPPPEFADVPRNTTGVVPPAPSVLQNKDTKSATVPRPPPPPPILLPPRTMISSGTMTLHRKPPSGATYHQQQGGLQHKTNSVDELRV